MGINDRLISVFLCTYRERYTYEIWVALYFYFL